MRNAIIIGGRTGVGASTAKLLRDAGWNVITTTHSEHTEGHLHWDVTTEVPDLSALPEEIHALVYCPGTIQLKPFKRFTDDDFRQDLEINLLGLVRAVRALESRLKAGSASVVTFSTVAVAQGMGFHASVAASKGAVEALTRSLAAEYAPTVRFNCIALGLTDTPLAERLLNSDAKREAAASRHPLKNIGNPDDVAAMVQLLVSGQGRFISGQTFGLDGGLSTLRTA
jgi:3-oxoacyl-[acyl-carrier protein] reductase